MTTQGEKEMNIENKNKIIEGMKSTLKSQSEEIKDLKGVIQAIYEESYPNQDTFLGETIIKLIKNSKSLSA